MRTADLPAPLAPHVPHPGTSPVARHLVVALERLPQAAYVWDDEDPAVCWDDPNPDRYIWDAPFIEQGFTDAVCDFQTVALEAGQPDEQGIFQAGHAVISLANPTGDYSLYTPDGRLTYFAPGRRVQILGVADGEPWWLFAGRVARWDVNADNTVTIEAFDGFALLAQEVGGKWTPGTAGDTPAARITAIATSRGYPDRLALDVGNVTLDSPQTDRSPLEEIETAALSDGGTVYVDADGTFTYRDRTWPAGRPDQPTPPVFSDNICDADVVVWELQLTSNDDGLATVVRLVNSAGLVAQARLAGGFYGIDYVLSHPDPDLWQTQAQGDQLAAALLAARSHPGVGVEAFTLHLTDPHQPQLWRRGLDLRLGDRIRIVHDQAAVAGGINVLDNYFVVVTITHEITPDEWVTTVGTTRTVDYTPLEQWDRTRWLWDDTDPTALWHY